MFRADIHVIAGEQHVVAFTQIDAEVLVLVSADFQFSVLARLRGGYHLGFLVVNSFALLNGHLADGFARLAVDGNDGLVTVGNETKARDLETLAFY